LRRSFSSSRPHRRPAPDMFENPEGWQNTLSRMWQSRPVQRSQAETSKCFAGDKFDDFDEAKEVPGVRMTTPVLAQQASRSASVAQGVSDREEPRENGQGPRRNRCRFRLRARCGPDPAEAGSRKPPHRLPSLKLLQPRRAHAGRPPTLCRAPPSFEQILRPGTSVNPKSTVVRRCDSQRPKRARRGRLKPAKWLWL
jgi:hypothetical protein